MAVPLTLLVPKLDLDYLEAGTQTDFRLDIIRRTVCHNVDDGSTIICPSSGKRKSPGDEPENSVSREIKKAKLETKALKAKRPGFTDERYNETSYYVENGLRKVYPYYFTFTTFTKGRWVGERILDVFAREFRAHPVEEYERCIKSGTLTVNYTKVDTDYRLKHNDLLANIVHRHEVPVTSDPIEVIFMDDDLVVVNKPASIPVHPCGRYRHNTVVFILAKEHQLKNLRTIHRLDRLTSGLLLFGRSPKKAREMEHQIRNRLVQKEYVCRVEGEFPDGEIECGEPIEVVSYKIGVCKVSKDGKECRTTFKKLSFNGKTSVVIARPKTGRMHQIRVHLQFLGYPIVNDPLYNHPVFGPEKGKGGLVGKTDEELIAELISIHNAENWLGIEGEESGGQPGDIFGPPQPRLVESQSSVSTGNNPLSQPDKTGQSNESSCDLKRDTNSENKVSITDSNHELCGNDKSSTRTNNFNGTRGELTMRQEDVTDGPLEDKNVQRKQEEEKLNYSDNERLESRKSNVEKCEVLSFEIVDGKVTVGTQTSNEDSASPPATELEATQEAGTCTTSSILTPSSDSSSKSAPTGLASPDTSSSPAQNHNNDSSTPNNGSSSTALTNPNPHPHLLPFTNNLMTQDPHCYECKVRYRDPKPKDLVMYLHALSYRGPGWCYETKYPQWASEDWIEPDETTSS